MHLSTVTQLVLGLLRGSELTYTILGSYTALHLCALTTTPNLGTRTSEPLGSARLCLLSWQLFLTGATSWAPLVLLWSRTVQHRD